MPESHEFIHYLLIVIGGAIAGFLNVLTGGGALISLPLLMGVGLPSTWANGTNRVVVIMQDIAALFKFAKNKKIPFRIALILGIATALGTLIGSFGAVHLNKNFLNYVIFCIIILVIIYVIFQPKKKTQDIPTTTKAVCAENKINFLTLLIFFLISAYAGFIQAGAAFLWIAAINWRFKVDMVTASAIRLFQSLVMAPISLIVFACHHQVSFMDGFIMGAGGFLGAWIAAKVAMKLNAHFARIMMLIILAGCAAYILIFRIIAHQ